MKKNYILKQVLFLFVFFFAVDSYSQIDYYDCVSGNGTSGNARAPQGTRRYARSVYLITAAELTASGLVNSDIINSIAFTYTTAQDIATTGNLTVYLQNTADATNLKSTTWSTAITGMTTVSNSALNIGTSTGSLFIPFSGGSPFTYTGGAVYVAFDYQNAAGTIATVAPTVKCGTSLTNGLKGAQSQTAAPTTLASSSFRPVTKLGKASTCSRPTDLSYNTAGTLTTNPITWVSPDSGSNFILEYGPYNFTPGAGTTVNVTGSSYTITGLSDSTVYDFYLKKDCGAGNNSISSNPSSFATQFIPANTPYNTGFEQEVTDFIGWKVVPGTLGSDWAIGNYGAGALVQEGVSSVVSITPAASAADNLMVSRGVNLTAGSTVTINYYLSNFVASSTNTGTYQLTWGTDQTAITQTNIIATETGLNTAAFTSKTFNFVAPSTGAYYFGFKNQSPMNAAGTHALIIDNFTVSQVLSSESFTLSGVKMYPNPAKDVLNIQSDVEELTKVSITDLNGRVVKEVTNNLSQISLGDLSAGIYMVKIESATAKKVEKLIIE
jgi:hypothetical protein